MGVVGGLRPTYDREHAAWVIARSMLQQMLGVQEEEEDESDEDEKAKEEEKKKKKDDSDSSDTESE